MGWSWNSLICWSGYNCPTCDKFCPNLKALKNHKSRCGRSTLGTALMKHATLYWSYFRIFCVCYLFYWSGSWQVIINKIMPVSVSVSVCVYKFWKGSPALIYTFLLPVLSDTVCTYRTLLRWDANLQANKNYKEGIIVWGSLTIRWSSSRKIGNVKEQLHRNTLACFLIKMVNIFIFYVYLCGLGGGRGLGSQVFFLEESRHLRLNPNMGPLPILIITSPYVLSRVDKQIYHGQPYAKVDLNPMPELTLSSNPVRDFGFGFCS